MGKQAGIDDSGDPLWASLIQNRVRDHTPLSSSDRVVVTTMATEILKSTLHTIAKPSGLKYPSSQFRASSSLRAQRTKIE